MIDKGPQLGRSMATGRPQQPETAAMFEVLIQHPSQTPMLYGLVDHVVRQARNAQSFLHHMIEGLDGGADQRCAQVQFRSPGTGRSGQGSSLPVAQNLCRRQA